MQKIVAQKKRDDQSGARATAAANSLSRAVGLRPGSPRDFDFAFRLYRETMKDYSAPYIRWDDKRQKTSLANQLGTAEISVITLGNADVGWLALTETQSSIVLGHFYIEPQFQNRGVGSMILNRLLATAAAKAKPVELSVLKNNPARRLYERSGFVVVSENEMKCFMRRPYGI